MAGNIQTVQIDSVTGVPTAQQSHTKAADIYLASLISGEDATNNVIRVEGQFSFVNYSTNQTTTVIKGSAGFLHSVVINTKGTVASVTTVYDSTGAASNPIAAIDSLNLSGTFTFDCILVNGLVISTTGTAAPNVTVTYR